MTDSSATLIGNRYRVLSLLGRGGMGTVYRVYDRLNSQVVALKRIQLTRLPDATLILHPSTAEVTQDAMLSLAREFKTLSSLRHPHVISVLDYGFDAQQQPYFTMMLLEGAQSLTQYAQGKPFLTQMQVLIQTLQALAYVHRLGILHRDIKPDNVPVVNEQVKVLDFGLAVMRGHGGLTGMESTAGTIAYMSPEVLQQRPPTEASDLYAVGVMAYEMIVGTHPYRGTGQSQLIENILTQMPDIAALSYKIEMARGDNTSVDSGQLAGVIQRLLHKDPSARYMDAQQVIVELCVAANLPTPEENNAVRESFLQSARMVGRETELTTLEQAMEKLLVPAESGGEGSAWLIGGESGVGKSRLLESMRVRALVNGMLVLRGQATLGGNPYQLWREVLRRLLLSVEVSPLEASILKEVVADIELLLETPVATAPDIEGAARGLRLRSTIEAIFQRLTTPTMLFLEDLQWADEEPELLRRLVALVSSLPLLIIGSYRNDEKPDLPAQFPGIQTLRLPRLSASEIAELSEAILGQGGKAEPVVSLLQRETEGNAFFLIEVVRALAQTSGGLHNVGLSTLPPGVLAGGIQNIVQHRLKRVPATARPLLELTAMVGRLIDLDVARLLATTLNTNLEECLTLCANAAVIDIEDEQWRFAHDKIRAAVLSDIAETRRPGLYRQVAEAVEQIHGEDHTWAAALLEYWTQAGNAEKQAYYAQLAGEQAVRISNFKQALLLFTHALEQLEPTATSPLPRLQAWLSRGEVYFQLGKFAEAQEDYESVLALAKIRQLPTFEGESLYGLSQLAVAKGDWPNAERWLHESLPLAQQTAQKMLLARVLYGIGDIAWRKGELETARDRLLESLNVAREANLTLQIIYALNRLGAVHQDWERRSEARVYFAEAKELALRAGNRERVAAITMNAALVDYFEGKYDQARTNFLETLALAKELESQHLIAVALLNLGDVSLRIGDVTQARQYLYSALELSRRLGAISLMLVTMTNIGALRSALGDFEGALDLFGLTRAHAAVDANTMSEQERFLKVIEEELTPAEIQNGLERGKHLNFEKTVAELLTEILPSDAG